MKFGIRKPSLTKSVKSRTTGRAKRMAKSSINPIYQDKGTGLVTHPSRSVKNGVYKRTTKSIFKLFK